MLKNIRWGNLLALLALVLFAEHEASRWDKAAFAQSGSASPISGAVDAYLSATQDNTTQAYITDISASPSNAWNAGAQTLGSAPQQVGPVPNGVGQVNLPGVGTLKPSGSYQEDLAIPNGVPIFGGWNTGIQTTVKTYSDGQGHTVEAAVDPLSAFNYALSHGTSQTSGDGSMASGFAMAGNWLGNMLGGHSSGGNGSAYRIDPGLALALNGNYGQGMGNLFGVGLYVNQMAGGSSGFGGSVPLGGIPGVDLGEEPPAPSLPPLTGIPAVDIGTEPPPTEEVFLKAVNPQPEPNFELTFQPPFPMVIGQDPTKRGVDVLGRATLGACTVTWHHVLRTQWEFCGKATCDCTKDNCSIRETTKEWDTNQLEPDQMAGLTIDSALTTKSTNYINGPMQTPYPGAKVQMGAVRVYPSAWANVVENAIGAPTTWAMLAARVPYADPGDWDFHVALQTTGTPHCRALTWSKDFLGALTVWLREQRLVK